MTSEEKHTPLSDTIHNLKVVREALEAEGLAVHVKLIDQAIEDLSATPTQTVQLPPIPIHWARPKGDTFDEMRDNVWETGLATVGDTILIWVNEGDFLHAQIVCGEVEYPQLSHNTQTESAPQGVPTEQDDIIERLKDHALFSKSERCKLFVEAAAEISRLRSQAGSAAPTREEIARIIDPDAFVDAMVQDDLTPSERMYFSANRETEKLNALAKADDIRALSRPDRAEPPSVSVGGVKNG